MIQKILKNCAFLLYFLIWLLVLTVLFFSVIDKQIPLYTDNGLENHFYIADIIDNKLLFLFGILLAVCTILLLQKREAVGNKKIQMRTELWIAVLICFLLQLILTYNIFVYTGLDTSILRKAAMHFANGSFDSFYNLEYFQRTPNNLFLYILNIWFYKLGLLLNINGFILFSYFCNLLTALSVFLTGMTVWNLTGNVGITRFSYVVSILLFGLSPWIMVPYSDTLSIFGPILTLYLYVTLPRTGIPAYLKYFLLLFIPLFMYNLKPLNIILLIAIVIAEVLHLKKTFFMRKNLLLLAAAICSVAVLSIALQKGAETYTRYVADDSKRMPISYYLVLGTDYNTYGAWSAFSAEYMLAPSTQEEKNAAALSLIKQRFSEAGITGYLHHYINKIHLFYNDGTFGWGAGGFFEEFLPEKNSSLSPLLRNIFYPCNDYGLTMTSYSYGKYYVYYALFTQFLWINILVFSGFLILSRKAAGSKYVLALSVALIGVFLFDMLFETSTRLMYSQIPLYIVAASIGLCNLSNFLEKFLPSTQAPAEKAPHGQIQHNTANGKSD